MEPRYDHFDREKDMGITPSGHDDAIIEVRVNCPDQQTAEALADVIVGQRLAAAANIYPLVSSRYHWQGKIETASEVPLHFKTRKSHFDKLAQRVTERHPYETPSIIGIEITTVTAAYRTWLIDETMR